MNHKLKINQQLISDPQGSAAMFAQWQSAKLDATERFKDSGPIVLGDLENPSAEALNHIRERCQATNLALYESRPGATEEVTRTGLRALAGALDLRIAERHRSAGDQGIVALTYSQAPRQKGYIPYSRRGMNWHTDGYYNAQDAQIRAFVLHCVNAAANGGENQLMDPEIAFMRLYEADPRFILALAHPEAMTIPANEEPDGSVRPASVGPVFSVDPQTGRLVMRYTARTRSIAWRDDPATSEAIACLADILQSDDPYMMQVRLKPGQGIMNNNVLHNRTAFDDADGVNRVVFRVRFHNRITGRE